MGIDAKHLLKATIAPLAWSYSQGLDRANLICYKASMTGNEGTLAGGLRRLELEYSAMNAGIVDLASAEKESSRLDGTSAQARISPGG